MATKTSGKKAPNLKLGVSNFELKRPRVFPGHKGKEVIEPPYLVATQIESYKEFLQADTAADQRRNVGLHGAFLSVFPIESYSGQLRLEYVSYSLGEPLFNVQECRLRGLTYAAPLRVTLRLVIYDKTVEKAEPAIKVISEQEVYMGDIPLMT